MRGAALTVVATFLAATVLVAAPGAATHEEGDGIPCSVEESDPFIRGPLAVFLERSWVIVHGSPPADPAPRNAPTAVLVYQDTNGVDGIQRNDALRKDEPCGHGRDRLLAAGGCAATLAVSPQAPAPLDPRLHGCLAGADAPDLNSPPFTELFDPLSSAGG